MRPNPSLLWLIFRVPAGWAGVALVLSSVLCLTVGVFFLERETAFEVEGVRTTALVLAKDSRTRTTSKGGSRRIYEVRFGFKPGGGEPIEARQEAKLSDWNRFRVGQMIEVEYLPSDPEIARFYDPEAGGGFGWILIAAGLAPLLAGAGLLAWMIRDARRMRRVAREGDRAAALVKEIRMTSIKVNNRPQYRLVYLYEDWRGNEHEGVSRFGPAKRFEALKPGRGATVYVDRDDPTISAWSGDLS